MKTRFIFPKRNRYEQYDKYGITYDEYMAIEDAIRQEVRKKALSAKGYEDMMLTFAQARMEWEDYQEQEEILNNYRDERNRGIQTTARAVDEQVQRDDTGGVQQGGGGSGALLQGASPVSYQAGNGRAGEQSAGAGGSVADTDGASQGVRAEQEAEVSRLATDAVLLALRDAGIDVSVASDAQAEAVLGRITAGVELSRGQKRALDTAEQSRKTTIPTAVSSADGAKVLKNIDTAISEYENKGNKPKTFIGDIANALGINQPERSSKYATFETASGKVVTIRISNHNAKVSNFDNVGEEYGISIVITGKPNSKVTNDGQAHIQEYFYQEQRLKSADGKPLVEILKGIKQALYSGEYKDTTGLAEYQEVNAGGAEFHMVYHGSPHKFDAFDHSKMGSGEGAQAFGWGTYVTEVEGVARGYADTLSGTSYKGGSWSNRSHREIFPQEEQEVVDDVLMALSKSKHGDISKALSDLNFAYAYRRNDILRWENLSEEERQGRLDSLSRKSDILDTLDAGDFQTRKGNLYTVEIPDDTGSNYLVYDGVLTDAQAKEAERALYEEIIATDEEGMYEDAESRKYLREDLRVSFDGSTGNQAYGTAQSYLGSDKGASIFFAKLGYAGIKYPAEATRGGRADGASNYVIFKEEDAKIVNRVELMRTPQGVVYGWTEGGKIYLTEAGLQPETPIHEYTHIWANAMMQGNPEGWQSIKNLLKDTPLWDEVAGDANYQHISNNEDAIASEALSRFSGREGRAKLEAMVRQMTDGAKGATEKTQAGSVIAKMRKALSTFWKWVGESLFNINRFDSVEEVADRVLYDLMNGTELSTVAGKADMSEMERIVSEAKANGTYMQAPNGKPTNLNERQWVQVRTQAFKEWFGDWEKSARIEKLKGSTPIVNEYNGEYELNRESAKAWAKENVRGAYTNKDTGDRIDVSRVGIDKVTSHGERDDAHLKSLVSVPEIVEGSIFIDEMPNEKGNGKYDSYRYYISGIKIDGEDYTVKMVVGVKGDNKYYDHELTQIEKGQLIDSLNLIAKQVAEKQSTLSDVKDTKLVSLLQTNSSKVVDENGEPLVVYHGTNVDARFTMFDTYGSRYGLMGQGAYFTDDKSVATSYTKKEKGNSPRVYEVFLNIRNPLNMDAQGSREVWEGMFGDVDFSGVEGTNETFLRVVEEYLMDSEYPAYEAHEIVQYGYMDGGFDGMVHVGGGRVRSEGVKHNVKIAFEPNQIKSATDNAGTFDASNDDIRYQRGNGERVGVPVRSATRDAVERLVKRMQATGLNDVVVMEQAEFDRKLAEIRGRAYTARRQAEVNKRFNEDLNRQKAGTLPKRHVYQLGMPSEALLSGGLPNLPIELSAERLAGKASQTNHPFDLGNVVNLPTALANPIAVFDSKTQPHSKVILTELTDERGKNFVVALQVRISDGNRKSSIEVNSIRSIYPKDSKVAVSGWMNDGLLRWVDKGKAINYLSTQEPNYLAGGSEANSLSDATKIVESFENPIASRYEVSFAFENLTEERARELGYKSFRGQYLRSGTDTPNAKMRAEFGDMSVEEAREKFVSDFVERIFGSQKRDEKIRAFEDYLLRQGIEPVQSGKSESRYYYYNGTKYRFSGHVHPSGSMTNSTFNVVDFAADPHLIDEVEFMRTPQGVVYGFVTGDGVIYLNPSVMNLNTPIHEFGHLWNSFVRRSNPALWKQGADAVRNSVYWERVNSNPAYSGLSDEGKLDEALAMAIGDRGEALLSNGAGFNSIVLRGWLTRLWLWLKGVLGFGASLREFSDVALGDLLGGKALVNKGTKGVQRSIDAQVRKAEQETDVHPSESQKKSGNYRKGRVRIDGLNVSIEQPKGSVRSGVDENGKSWSITMNHTYGYIGGTKGKDGDHIDVFLSDNLDGWNGTVYVIDQVNDKGGFDEHKVMYGFNSQEEARKAYLSNYEDGWQGLGGITPVSKEVFKGWLQSSGRKTKAFAQYKGVKGDADADYQRDDAWEAERVNKAFNEQLRDLTEENKDRVVLSLGVPSAVLKSAGIVPMPMKLYGNKVIKKMKKHGFTLDSLTDLPRAVANPIAVFNNIGREGNRSILTELKTEQGNFLVTLDLGKDADVNFNVVSSVFGKGESNIVGWINSGYATYINKEKARKFLLHDSAPIADASANNELVSATKIVENFENPPISEENDVRYRRVEAEMSETERIVSEAKANGTYMQAPNGKATNLNERQWVQVRTQAFKEWFGDWENDPENSSKVVDENGEPKVVYHGTNETKEERVWNEKHGWFDTTHEPFYEFNARGGNFFNSDIDNAGGYGSTIYEVFLNLRNPLIIDANSGHFTEVRFGGMEKDTYEWVSYGRC